MILLEAAERIRRLTNQQQSAKHPHPLIVLVTKYDTWHHLLDRVITENPWQATSQGINALDTESIANCSQKVRRLLGETCPELVNAADGFLQDVTYLPVSALGRKPVVDPATGLLAVRPAKSIPSGPSCRCFMGWRGPSRELSPFANNPPLAAEVRQRERERAPRPREGGK